MGCSKVDDYSPQKPQTRFLSAMEGLSKQTFIAGDEIGIFPVGYVNGEPGTLGDISNPMNIKLTYDGIYWNLEEEGFVLEDGLYDIYAYYPYDNDLRSSSDKLNLSAYPFSISGKQEAKTVDFLWSKVSGVSGNQGTVLFDFWHLFARFEIHLEYDIHPVSGPDLRIHNTRTDCTINLHNRTITSLNKKEVIIPTTLQENVPDCDYSFEAIIIPQEVAAGTPLFTLNYQDNVVEFVLEQDVTFNPSNSYTFRLEMSTVSGRTGKYQVSVMPIMKEIR